MARVQQVLACLALAMAVCMPAASAFVFKAGGTGQWRVPGNGNAASYNTWAEHTRFRVGDAIAFTYQPGSDSVLIVDKKAYDACDTGSPVDTFSDGNTVFTFTVSGPFYFISGNKDNCNRGEKLVVVVMGPRAATNGTSTHAGALAPSPAADNGGQFSPPSPPPPFGINISPTGNPDQQNAAAGKAAGIAGTAALIIGTMLYSLV